MREARPADLLDHLAEMRTRLLRSGVYALLGMIAVWVFYHPIYRFLTAPMLRAMGKIRGEVQVTGMTEGFMIRAEVALVGGLILALPLIYWELWAFIAPGLTGSERRSIRLLVPVSGLLFLAGVALAYFMTEPSIVWMASMNPPDTAARYRLNENLLLLLKFYLAFGIAFQLPLVLVVLAALGIVDSRLLTRRWREATVVVFVIAAVITPTWDPLTMTICALPLCLLYLATIAIIRLIERRQAGSERDQTLAG